ncbi:uncharacterized protein LOC117168922 isoform X1 [Belonocnema kinseyi]|uniref:uncharacterized protein LOC117168922 isoform X1 n=1 Tax=Belonocnema kinseyi TaxID=2817044 RepID=UPI00143CF062|nr:uncharacterized protein LOC117168922 isoform X1 [Belonocnema kinseyi]
MLWLSEFWFLALCLQIVLSRPSEEPIKFNLYGPDEYVERFVAPQKEIATTKFQRGKEMLGYIADKIRFGRGRLVNAFMLATNIVRETGEDWLSQIKDAARIKRGRLVNSVMLARNNLFHEAEDNVSESQNIFQSVKPPKHHQTFQANTLQSYIQNPFPVINSARGRESAKLEYESAQSFLEKPKENPLREFLEKLSRPTPIVDGIREEQKYGNNGDKFIGIGRALVNGFEGLSNFVNVVIDLPMKAAKQTSRGLTEALNRVGARIVGLQ